MTASSGIIVLNNRQNNSRLVRCQNSIESKKSDVAIQLNRIDFIGESFYTNIRSINRKYDFYFMIKMSQRCYNNIYLHLFTLIILIFSIVKIIYIYD